MNNGVSLEKNGVAASKEKRASKENQYVAINGGRGTAWHGVNGGG